MNLDEKHQKLLDAQNAHPPTLTMLEMGEVLDMTSKGHLSWLLGRLVEAGLAEKIQRGTKHVYRMVELKYKKESHE
jgi:DNA-binding transcriptional ArsR family regulator